jgi:Ferredoxin-like domain in Api92-like protein
MPNWTSNKIEVEGPADQLRVFLDAIKGENGVLDFNSLIPMPSLLRHTNSGTNTIDGVAVHSWYVEQEADYANGVKEIARRFTQAEEDELNQIGYRSWYEWSIQHWGTKWNACDPEIIDEGSYRIDITFNTAWSAPMPIFKALKATFPTLTIRCHWRDEDESEYPHEF